ncbi:MAG: phosphatase PAP2 family protein [Luteolibacter sp.]
MKTRHKSITLAIAVAISSAADCGRVSAATTVQTVGDVLQIVLPTTAGGMTLYNKDGEGAMQLGKSLLLTMGVTYALKYTVNEQRPDGGSQSFPSGHTSVSFSSAEFIRKRYGWEYGVPAYALATFVGYSRVESKQHYAGDVVAGAFIGVVSSYFFTKPYKGWDVELEGDAKGAGVKFTRQF